MPNEPTREAREASARIVRSETHGNCGNEIIRFGSLSLPIIDHPGQTAVSVAMLQLALEGALDAFAAPLREEVERLEKSETDAIEELSKLKCLDGCDGGSFAGDPVCCTHPDCGCHGASLPEDATWCQCPLGVAAERDQLRERVAELEGELKKETKRADFNLAWKNDCANLGFKTLGDWMDTKARAEKAEEALESYKPLVRAARKLKTQTLQGDCILCGTGLSRGKHAPACPMCCIHAARKALNQDTNN